MTSLGEKKDPTGDLFVNAIHFAVKAAEISATKYETAYNDIVRDALFAISQDGVIIHRAIGNLTRSGWVGATPALLRVLMDLQISVAAILNSANPKLAAFRYFYSSYRSLGRDEESFSSEFRASARDTIRDRISRLPAADRPAALNFLKGKDRPYWYAEEWGKPTKVLGLFAPDLVDPYRRLSSAAHGGFFGSRLFREQPDGRSINAELPAGLKALEVRLTSSRLLVELTALRSKGEGLGLEAEAQALRQLIHKAGTTKEDTDA